MDTLLRASTTAMLRVGKRTLRSNRETDEGKRCAALANSLTKKAPCKAPGADSEEKHEPVSDIDTVVVDSLKALDPEWPIREADVDGCVPDRFERRGPGKQALLPALPRMAHRPVPANSPSNLPMSEAPLARRSSVPAEAIPSSLPGWRRRRRSSRPAASGTRSRARDHSPSHALRQAARAASTALL